MMNDGKLRLEATQKDLEYLWYQIPDFPDLEIWSRCRFQDIEVREEIYKESPQKGENVLLAIRIS